MSDSTTRTRHRSRWRGVLTLALVLSAGVVASLSVVNRVFGQTIGGTGEGVQAMAITALAAVIAVYLGLRLASKMGLDRPGAAATLNKAAVISLIFTVLLTPAALVVPSAGTALAGGVLGAGPGIGGELLNGLAAALIGQAAGLPLLFVTLIVLDYLQVADSPLQPGVPTRRTRLPRFAYIISALALLGVYGTTSGVSLASTVSAGTVTNSNPCSSAPHDTFNVSAINMTMILNKFGVNDPNAMQYVLNSNIAAVRAEDKAGTVSSGLQGNDPIQPLVLRAHMGDCVTVNFTNATTFGLEPFDQPPSPQASEPCDNVTATNPDGPRESWPTAPARCRIPRLRTWPGTSMACRPSAMPTRYPVP
jgi:hypothetical protein